MSVFLKRSSLRFSLSTMFVAVTVVACATWKATQVERQRQAVAWIEAQQGTVVYDYESSDDGHRLQGTQPPGPRWLREFVGVDWFASVRYAYIQDLSKEYPHFGFSAPDPPVTDLTSLVQLEDVEGLFLKLPKIRDISPLESLRGLKKLQLDAPYVEDLSPLGQLTHLEELNVLDTQASDFSFLTELSELRRLSVTVSGFKDIQVLSHMSELEFLDLSGTRIQSISALRNFTRLRYLLVTGTCVSDISSLSHLENLTVLCADSTRIDDLSPLTGLSCLRTLVLRDVPVSADQVRGLQEALPNCQVIQEW